MARWRDRFPERRNDPLDRVSMYVARKTGAVDELGERRRQRANARQPHVPVSAAVVNAPTGTVSVSSIDGGTVHREAGGAGVADRLKVRMKNAAGAPIAEELTTATQLAAGLATKAAAAHAHTYGVTILTNGGVVMATATVVLSDVNCGAGTQITGGGCGCTAPMQILDNRPLPNGWRCQGIQASGVNQTLTTYAICVEQPIT